MVRAVHYTSADILPIQHAAGRYGFQCPIFLLLLLKLVANPAIGDRLSTTSRTFVRSFTWTAIAQQHLEVSQNVLTPMKAEG
ncbi:MAG: hypothetical protein ICV63_14910 [Coleofasciculus sp. Co-bin14]|nr:hypothetical protein [Coleofasciculus sp. Co-bin14]